MRSVADQLRRSAAALLFVLTIGSVPYQAARAGAPNQEIADPAQALEFVDGLATQAYEALTDRTLDAKEHAARARSLIEHGFNVRYMSLLVLGPYARNFDDKMLEDYEAKFGDFLCGKYGSLVENYGVVRFRAINAEQVGRRDALVHLMIYRKGDAVDTEWRVRMFEGEPRIIDVEVAGFSLTQSERADFAALIKQSGFKGLFDALSSYSLNRPV
ncbi:MAG TPA: ABC transporter substrate-binding protein [Alphaproteobacteria bacterium]|nr:ABC transporter substrate-binding protein [Alphaproteobacteria bacterium]